MRVEHFWLPEKGLQRHRRIIPAMQTPIQYTELREALASIGFADEAAEYHGTLCGALCVKQPEEIDVLALLEASEQPPSVDAQTQTALKRLCQQALVALQDDNMAFAPLLPDDDTALIPRVQALAEWCEGFLFGLASRPGLDLNACSEDAREIIKDFAQFTKASVSDGEEVELEETAYTELVEYIRVGAQLIYMELRPTPTPDPKQSKAIH